MKVLESLLKEERATTKGIELDENVLESNISLFCRDSLKSRLLQESEKKKLKKDDVVSTFQSILKSL
jgi:hypothetical protein